jgi:hypothetical protein
MAHLFDCGLINFGSNQSGVSKVTVLVGERMMSRAQLVKRDPGKNWVPPGHGLVGTTTSPDGIFAFRARVVLGLQLHFRDGGKTQYFGEGRKTGIGGTGHTEHVWEVPRGHKIVEVNVWSRSLQYLQAVQFVTQKGTVSPKYGGTGGLPKKFGGAPELFGKPRVSRVWGYLFPKKVKELVGAKGICDKKNECLGSFVPVFRGQLRSGPTFNLALLYPCEGGGLEKGEIVLTTIIGMTGKRTVTSSLEREIVLSASTQLPLYTRSLGLERFDDDLPPTLGARCEGKLTIPLDRQCYVYQMGYNIVTSRGQSISVWGAVVVCSAPIPVHL